MSFSYRQHLPEPDEIKQQIPLSAEIIAIKKQRDTIISDVLTGKDDRLLVIIGPCSSHDEDAVVEYVGRLASLKDTLEEKLVLIPRIYTNKPRTLGTGYKGMLHQPDPLKKPNIVEGIKSLRAMHIRSIRESHLTAADEMLYPTNHPYLDDLLSYVAVGARSVENQQHRITASGVDIPVGMKNPVSGDLGVMLNSVQAAQASHVFTYNSWEVETTGNPLAHAILRGAADLHGKAMPNYHFEDLMAVYRLMEERAVSNPAVIVDTNHANSGKQYLEQHRIAHEVLGSMRYAPELKKLIKGLMIESYLVDGSQKPEGKTFGQSITDPCLGWEKTETLLKMIADEL